MCSVSVRGVSVSFPFTPYECQKEYMNRVMDCLQKKVNGVLESPTGTGKTLCLLCATLAWREHFKDTISARKITQRLKGEEMFPSTGTASWGSTATDGDTPAYYTDVPKIIYASRTHSQLAQVIGELKKISYRPKVCVLGSREQLCINQEVMRQENNHVKVHMCRSKVSTRSCVYYNNVEEKSSDTDLVHSILDVEDLVKYGTKHRVCPYYLSRSMKQQADIIFMPYNYLLDPKSRRTHNIELSGAVVIFDEAHNVEKTCEESTSFDLTPYDVSSSIKAVDALLMDKVKDAQGDDLSDCNMESLSSGLKVDVTAIAKIKQIFLDLEAVIDSYDVPVDKGITKPGIFIYELLERAHLTYSSKTAVAEALEQIISFLSGKPGIFLNTSGLQKLADIIQLVFCGEPSEKDQAQQMHLNTAQFKVHIHPNISYRDRKATADVWGSASAKKQGNILSYWCFSSGFSMQDLVHQGVRCIILTSGTLSPLASFTSEMRIEFPVQLENSHVIERDQIFVSVIDRGPDGVHLSSAFDRRFVPENMASLGNTVVNLSRVVPHGLLVFFPSFPLMEKTLDFWRTHGHADRIENIKPMFVEPKGKGTFNEVIDGFYSRVNDPSSKGGSFFAVCRGKASEGLDFSDSFGRGVVITGLPFPPKMDPRVILKMEFLDEMSRKKAPGLRYLSGQQWYRLQAFRAVNQAIGRVIRHKDDYGAVLLCDQRFKNADARAQLPSWIRPHVRLYDNFGNVVRDVSQFFRVAQKMRPVVQKEHNAGTSKNPGTSENPGKAAVLDTRCPPTQRAKVLDAHIPSLKKRRLNDPPGASGMARLCVEYEGEAPQTHKRPLNLFHALDQGDRRPGQDEDSWTGPQCLQYKRTDVDAKGGKRKIKVVHEQKLSMSSAVCEEDKASRAKRFLQDMKKSLSHVKFEQMVQALQTYKRTDHLDGLLTQTAALAEDANTHGLLRGFYQFVRPHHKLCFDQTVLELTGRGCGYKPVHSVSKEDRDGPPVDRASSSTGMSTTSQLDTDQLDTDQLNHGGPHLHHSTDTTHRRVQKTEKDGRSEGSGPVGSGPVVPVHAAFVSDVQSVLGSVNSGHLFRAVHRYKRTDNYEELVSVVVSLLTEDRNHFSLLHRFSMLIRPHHKKQYKEMLEDLSGGSGLTAQETNEEEEKNTNKEEEKNTNQEEEKNTNKEEEKNTNQEEKNKPVSLVKTQSKISAFFSNSQSKN
ncbi:regulator of telomere elongation helicase 1 isoform X2 [Sphaeramia orbicularis]|uniref:regulator of telomere elongation helicase 1 isoform X2 n=1 Tax=Sphaeramia orbicularis TaxID=375764 RepID=UPI0011800595|nr:regulator of telomere elongation helicase 1 isoform X2 [Sphaeramia orbicularis]